MLWNVSHPDTVRAVHTAYLEAGATLITANTFSANALTLKNTGLSVAEVVTAGVTLAREAVERHGTQGCFVVLDVGPLGELLCPLGQIAFDDAVALFKEQVEAGSAAGADCILIETMIDTYELKAAVLAAQEASNLPVLATVAINRQGNLLNGADIACVCALLEGLGVDALGLNCGDGLQETLPFIKKLRALSSTPLVFSPNAGLPIMKNGEAVYTTSIEEFASTLTPLAGEYAAVLGGCCGTTPAHIEALAAACEGISLRPEVRRRRCVISSYASSLALDETALRKGMLLEAGQDEETTGENITAETAAGREATAGEALIVDTRIDAATNAELAEALALGDYEYAADEALDAQGEGARIIGVSATLSGADEVSRRALHASADDAQAPALPVIDEAQALPAMIEAIQALVNVPLFITATGPTAFERALRVYNGCALIALDRCAAEDRDTVRALAARYGAVIREAGRESAQELPQEPAQQAGRGQ
jgi:5-methyltetrahydrofolate--homocysteine methyltransferase